MYEDGMTEKMADIGEALYAISLNLIERSSPDLMYKFIGSCSDEDGCPLPDDGIMMTTGGYYRVAEDVETGNRVVLFSFSYEKLRGRHVDNGSERDGHICLAETDGVYPVIFRKKPPFGIIRGGALRSDISQHHYELQKAFKEDLNLYGAGLTDLFNTAAENEDQDRQQVLKFGNTMLSYGIYETADNKWDVRRRIREKQTTDERNEAVLGLDKAGSGKFLDKILSDGESIGAFDKKSEAMTAMVLDFDKRSDRCWNAQPFLEPSEIAQAPVANAKRGILGQVKNFIKNRSLGELVFVGGFAALSLPFSGKFRVGLAAIGIAAVYANKFFEQIFVSATSGLQKLGVWKRKDSAPENGAKQSNQSPETPPRQTLDDYAEDTDNNKERICPRMRQGVAQHLRLLTSEEADLKPEDMPYSRPPHHGHDVKDEQAAAWAKLEMPSLQNSAFKAIATPLDSQTMSYYYLMGAVAVTHTHEDHSRSVYMTMRADMKVSEESFIRADVEPFIQNANVLHIHQSPGEEPSMNVITTEDMLVAVKELLYRNNGKPNLHVCKVMQHTKGLFGFAGRENGATADPVADLADLYASTPGGERTGLINFLKKGAPATLPEANPTPEQIDEFIRAKKEMRAAFERERRLHRSFEGLHYPDFGPLLKKMDLG